VIERSGEVVTARDARRFGSIPHGRQVRTS
jgi:hypothetical protein